jgi:hypothetical protein
MEHRIWFQPRDEVEHIASIHNVIKAGLDLAARTKMATALFNKRACSRGITAGCRPQRKKWCACRDKNPAPFCPEQVTSAHHKVLLDAANSGLWHDQTHLSQHKRKHRELVPIDSAL